MNIPNKFERIKQIKKEDSIYFYNLYYREEFLIEDYHISNNRGGGPLRIYKMDKKIQFGDILYSTNWNEQLIIETTTEYQLKLSNNIIIICTVSSEYAGPYIRYSNEYQEYPIFNGAYTNYYLKLNKNTTYYFIFNPDHSG